MVRRIERVKESLMREVSDIIHHELKDPRIGFVTLIDVELSVDMRYAKIFVSVLGSEKEKKDTMIGLSRAKGFIRKEIGSRIRMRYTPEINFKLDRSCEHAQQISDIFMKIEKMKDSGIIEEESS